MIEKVSIAFGSTTMATMLRMAWPRCGVSGDCRLSLSYEAKERAFKPRSSWRCFAGGLHEADATYRIGSRACDGCHPHRHKRDLPSQTGGLRHDGSQAWPAVQRLSRTLDWNSGGLRFGDSAAENPRNASKGFNRSLHSKLHRSPTHPRLYSVVSDVNSLGSRRCPVAAK